MQFEVDRHDIRTSRHLPEDRPAAAPGQAVLEVERFALTANNVTYAVFGEGIGYWFFFPTDEPWIRVPVMGYATVVDSGHEDVEVGRRVFGFFPMGRWLTVEPRPTGSGFDDASAHRAAFPAVYNSFLWVPASEEEDADEADRALLLRGLFLTSFLQDDYLEDNDFFGATQVIVLSASSKTGIALGHRLAQRHDIASIGVTGVGNVDMVEGLGLYDTVISYDDIATLDPSAPTVSVDMAGNGDALAAVHAHFGDELRFSSRVGGTHWENLAGPEIVGVQPEMFFAPSQIEKRTKEWGSETFASRSGEALAAFIDDSRRWMTVERSAGTDEIERVFTATVDGEIPPDRGQILFPED